MTPNDQKRDSTPPHAGRRVFVAGATGVLGRGAVPQLLAEGHQVTAVGRTADKRQALERIGARAITLDLFDPGAVREALRGMEVVINLATAVPAIGPRMFLRRSWRPMDRVRREISANLVDGALAGDSVERYIQESFAPIYEDGGDSWLDETAPVRPARYNSSVLDAEGSADRFTRAGRTGVVLRFGMFYGPDDAATRQVLDALRRGWFPLFGRPEGYVSWISHSDAARAAVAAVRVPAGTYNVVEDTPLRRKELAAGLAELLGAKAPRFVPGWATRVAGGVGETVARSLRISNRRMRQAGGWAPRDRNALDGFRVILGKTS